MRKIRVGGGAGYGGDRIEPAADLIRYGELDYIIFECLAERTIALAQQQKMKDSRKGYNELLKYRMSKVLPLLKEHRVRIVTNMGAANPRMAMEVTGEMAREYGLKDLKIVGVFGDSIIDRIDHYMDCEILETKKPLRSVADKIISANAYIGAAGIAKALDQGADIVIASRVADPALTLGPLIHEFGWSMDDYDKLGKGTVCGHLLECGAQVCGGYFADPPYKSVPNLENLGFPIAEISEDGNVYVTKLPQAGGIVSRETVSEQLIYEIHDPKAYYTPDVVADFSGIQLEETADGVKVSGASGHKKTGKYKVSVAYQDGFIGEGEISYAGGGAAERAQLALDIIKHRLEPWNDKIEEVKYDIIGMNSLHADLTGGDAALPKECRVRVAIRTADKEIAKIAGNEVEALYTNGPSGGGGARKYVREIISIASIFIPEEDIEISTEVWEGEKT